MQYEGVPAPGEPVIPAAHNLFKIAVLLTLLGAAFTAGDRGARALQQAFSDATWMPWLKWLWLLGCGVVASSAVQGLGVLAHDAVHKVLLPQRRLNEWLGGIISAIALLPFNANRQFHLDHHRFSHQQGAVDPEHPMHHHRLWFAVSIGSLIGLALQYRILLRNLVTLARLRLALRDLLSLAIAATGYILLLSLTQMSFMHTLLPMLLVLPLVFGLRAISDHFGLPAVERHAGKAVSVQQEVSGWVILTSPLLEWLWSSVNYHEVHHKFPYLPHSYLKPVFAATRDRLPYAVANGYLRNLWRHRRRRYYHSAAPRAEVY